MGRQIGNWKLKTTLGSGSFGEVKYAIHNETGKAAAIKVCAKQALAKGQGRTLLQREIATMKELNHPAILKLYEVLETPRHFYLVLELAAGGELFDLIQENKRFGDSTARRYFQQLILGVRYCHEQGIVHRDLKPQNLLLTARDELKIADFGFSNFQNLSEDGKVTPALRLQTQCGTPNYAAPEIFLGKGYDGFKTDIWACGVILYVMLCGHVPFRPCGKVAGLQGVILSIVEGHYSIPNSISPDAADLISKILERNVDKRLTIAGIIEHPWFQAGFDNNRLFILPKIVVSDASIRNSIRPGVEQEIEEDDEEVSGLGTSCSDAGAAGGDPEIVDALAPPSNPQTNSENRNPGLPPAVNEAIKGPGVAVGCDHLGRSLKGFRSGSAAALLASGTTSKRSESPKSKTPHVFQRKHWNTPHWCFICNKFIYGIGKQGFSCINCSCPVHIKCVEVATAQSSCEAFRLAGSPQVKSSQKPL